MRSADYVSTRHILEEMAASYGKPGGWSELTALLAMATGRKGNLVTMACKSFSFDFLWKVGHPQIEAFNNNCNVSDLKRATPFRLSLASYDTLMVLY